MRTHLLSLAVLLTLPVPGEAIEAYRAKTPEVYRGNEVREYRGGEAAVDRPAGGKRQPEGRTEDGETGGDARPKRMGLARSVENAAVIAARNEVCGLPDRGIRQKMIAYLTAAGRPSVEVARYAAMFDKRRTAMMAKAGQADTGSLCSAGEIRRLTTATDQLVAKLGEKPPQAAPPAAQK